MNGAGSDRDGLAGPAGGAIRLAGPGDLPRISAIRLGVRENRLDDPGSITTAMCVTFMADHGDFWVHDIDGVITGFSAADRRDGSVWALFVDAPYTGRGIGLALLRRACATLREAGYRYATLTTGAGTYAEGFYRTDGWVEMSRTRKGEIGFRKGL